MRRTVAGTLTLLLLLPVLGAQDKPQGKTKENPKVHKAEDLVVGKAAPEIQGEDIDGEQFRLSDYRGKVVLLDFWGHW